ncbi:TMEM175 family protein [Sphingomonas sp. AR_OL41]|uniref:TMEM175 family protein n=1 Tax=Sphingomonas sp. AR_OL41 TaxID=3042729 RepID=UPI002480036C|nr:TMEM175 family protein [Sphingomonas sp. AR_OL41]MDH7975602.1 TMEM175 family protein [Sphingomonas sp. AR_OL41]
MTTSKKAGADRPDHALERLIFFSDAVFAIAITLLVIELHPPHVERGHGDMAYIIALYRMIPNFFGFFVSFWVIAAFWSGHHRAFALTGHYSPRLIKPNLAMLCSIAFMPFTTAFMAEYLGATVPTALYNLSLIVTGLLNLRLIHIATSPPVVSQSVDRETIMLTRSRGWGVTLAAVLAFALSLVDARYSQMALLTIPLWMRLAAARARRRLAAERISS